MQCLLRSPKTIIFEPQSDPFDLRLKNIIRPWNKQINRVNVGIVGIPFDLGVKLSNGRVGTAQAPDAIRGQIKKYGTSFNASHNIDLSHLLICDFGNIKVEPQSVREVHEQVSESVRVLFALCDTLIVLGGGNDLSYATIKAYNSAQLQKKIKPPSQTIPHKIAGMNVDAHLDVRKVRDGIINSGTPYRRLIENKILKGENLFEVGIQGHTNSKIYWGWAKNNGMRIWTLEHTREIGIWAVMHAFRSHLERQSITDAFVSIDIDAVAQAFAPGSSAPSPDGLFPKDILEIAYFAGTMPQVRLFEIMEVNPQYDQDNRTSRLAVNIILEFLAGYTKRAIV